MTIHTSGPVVLAVIIVLASISTLAVSCRLSARYRHVRNSGIEYVTHLSYLRNQPDLTPSSPAIATI